MNTLHFSIIAILVVMIYGIVLGSTKSYAAYDGPECDEKEAVGFSPVASNVAFISNQVNEK